MKNLDDLLKEKVAKAEEDQRAQAEQDSAIASQADVEARGVVEAELSSLEKIKEQLAVIKESLSMEQEGKGSAARERKNAESKIDAKVDELEAVGLTKEEILTNPEYKEVEEVKGVNDAAETEAVFATPSIGSRELQARLTTLAVELPEGETNEQSISRAIEARMAEIDTNILETRLKIPSEREKVVADIISSKRLKIDDLETVNGSSSPYGEKGTFKDVYSGLERKLHSLSVVKNNPEIEKAVMEEMLKEALLDKNKKYQEKSAKRDEHFKKLEAYESAKEKLPEYIDFLNKEFFNKITDAIDALDERVAREVWSSSEMQSISDVYNFNYREKKITSVKLPDNALPSVNEMNRLMSSAQKPWDSNGNLEYALQGIVKLKGVTIEDFRNRRSKLFEGNLRAILKELPPKETVPYESHYTDETYQKWDAAFKRAEDRAESQAAQFTEYVELSKELRSEDTYEIRSEKDGIEKALENLRLAASRLANGGTYRVQDGKVINVSIESQKQEQSTEKTRTEEAKVDLEKELSELGPKPEGLFSGKKKDAWEVEKNRLTKEIATKTEYIQRIDVSLRSTNEDWTNQLNLPADVVEQLEGQTTQAGEISNVIYSKMEELQPRAEELRHIVQGNDTKRIRLQEMEKKRFVEGITDDFSGTGL
ncbi:hypothetical protein BH11PAT2_BH11PAT2_07090 [soil metagenome]